MTWWLYECVYVALFPFSISYFRHGKCHFNMYGNAANISSLTHMRGVAKNDSHSHTPSKQKRVAAYASRCCSFIITHVMRLHKSLCCVHTHTLTVELIYHIQNKWVCVRKDSTCDKNYLFWFIAIFGRDFFLSLNICIWCVLLFISCHFLCVLKKKKYNNNSRRT